MEEICSDSDRCYMCANYMGDLACIAFPDRIPDEILFGINPHTKPFKDQDNDIVFEPRKKDSKNNGISSDKKH